MKTVIKEKKILIIIFGVLLAISFFFRFYNINWGSPFYFHPDERNIASSISQLNAQSNMNPYFFAYGSFPIYICYLSGVAVNSILSFFDPSIKIFEVKFESAILLLRLFSALLSVGTVLLIFKLILKKLGLINAIIGTLLAAFNVGLIQYSHFGTFEIWLTFLFLLELTILYDYLSKPNINKIVQLGIVIGLLISIKVSSIITAPIIIFVIAYKIISTHNNSNIKRNYANAVLQILLITTIALLVSLSTSPFYVLDFNSFVGSMRYESNVALGNLKVFYTGGFENTIPIIYQLKYVYPYILNPLNLIFIILTLPLTINLILKRHSILPMLALLFFLAIFISQAFFYVKWIRYYIPTIPFLIVILIYGFNEFTSLFKKKRLAILIITAALLTTSIIFSVSYFNVVLLEKDSRIKALEFAEKNIPPGSRILSEVYDMGIVPFNQVFNDISLFDFYALDDISISDLKKTELNNLIDQSDYFILPSQRIIRNRIINSNEFPNGNLFYNNLDQKYKLIYETKCNNFCKILYLNNPIFAIEETANVFDRPILRIYKIHE